MFLALATLLSTSFVPPTSAWSTTRRTVSVRAGWPRLAEEPNEARPGNGYESAATRAAAERAANLRTFNADEETALRVCRIEFAPYPAGKYNKIEEEGGRAAAFDQCRKDLPALSSWSDLEIEATYTSLKVRQLPAARSLRSRPRC